MKKFIASMTIAAALLLTGACGSSGWNKADKAELDQGLAAGEALGLFTHAQTSCLSSYLQSHWGSMEEANKASDSDTDGKLGDALLKTCNIDPASFKDFGSN